MHSRLFWSLKLALRAFPGWDGCPLRHSRAVCGPSPRSRSAASGPLGMPRSGMAGYSGTEEGACSSTFQCQMIHSEGSTEKTRRHDSPLSRLLVQARAAGGPTFLKAEFFALFPGSAPGRALRWALRTHRGSRPGTAAGHDSEACRTRRPETTRNKPYT